MTKQYAFIFPGQGAQTVGMGKDFYESHPLARETFEEAETILGRHLSKIVFEGPAETLTETRNSQTGIFVTSIAMLRVIQKQFPHLVPAMTSGLSLGEYTALVASGKLTFANALRLMDLRSQFMNEACETTKGTMAAIFGLSSSEIEQVVASLNMPQDLWVANYNCPGQTVISGTTRGVEEGIKAATAKGAKRAIPLKVHGAFHSGLMQLAQDKLAPFIQEAQFTESPTSIVMNVTGGFVKDVSAIRHNLAIQVTHPVKWQQGIASMQESATAFFEIGCGRTLAGLNKQIGVSQPTITINKITDLDELAKWE